ncbi:capsular polysaccharide biosynthesis protein [Aromatoleum sp.]|uniref:capsular polysaccharide biosynthesis protein n=1 Tax=Aromatoleum sp. TaxID=2307007 RepID=UPI002FC9E1C3
MVSISPPCRLAVLTRGVQRVASLPALLADVELLMSRRPDPFAISGVLAWGRKPSALVAEAYAARHGISVWRVEDGFLRSVGLGDQDPPLSLVLDDQGVYYDSTSTSCLESLVRRPLEEREAVRAAELTTLWRAGRVSKYNHLREYAGELPERYVLVVDQTFGDASLQYGLAGPEHFQRMLQAALEENPASTVLVKIHPDVFAGRKRGHFDVAALSRMARVQVLAEDAHPVRLIEQAQAVYVVTSQMGFEGLLWGKPVRTFGMPFYAGWGLTRDELPAPERRGRATLEQLVHAALVDYPRYIDPETGKRCEVERLIEWMALQRRMRERFPAVVHALGFSRWKKPIVRDFLQGSEVRFVRRADEVPAGGTLAVWGRKDVGPCGADLRVLRLEDGFLRSVGLGADLIRPLSWVTDGRGIYYDGTAPSDLEHLLQTAAFDDKMLARARRLRDRIVGAGLTKYNVGAAGWSRPSAAARVVLVPGQVETDASIRYGAGEIRTNMGLLQAVRRVNPDAWIVYKPHPDVLAGLRGKGEREDQALSWCDEVVIDVGMGELLPKVDEVHVLTSLAGFEALMRGKSVTCYGLPFYAGWGLTTDLTPAPRRARRLALDELLAAALILYPTYVSRTTGRFTTPERALDELLAWREQGPSGMPAWRKALRWVLQGWARVRRA